MMLSIRFPNLSLLGNSRILFVDFVQSTSFSLPLPHIEIAVWLTKTMCIGEQTRQREDTDDPDTSQPF
jgi:hypothetical protein